ncbi:MAG: cell division protein FtsL [bacterium]|nr:cell division protein FtsL [bacterium]
MTQRRQASAANDGWRRNQTLVRERDEERVRWLWRTLFGIIVALLPVGAHRYHQNAYLEVVYELNELRAESGDLIEEQRRLDLERSRLEALTRITRWADRQPGLVQPDPRDVHIVHRRNTNDGQLVAGAEPAP